MPEGKEANVERILAGSLVCMTENGCICANTESNTQPVGYALSDTDNSGCIHVAMMHTNDVRYMRVAPMLPSMQQQQALSIESEMRSAGYKCKVVCTGTMFTIEFADGRCETSTVLSLMLLFLGNSMPAVAYRHRMLFER